MRSPAHGNAEQKTKNEDEKDCFYYGLQILSTKLQIGTSLRSLETLMPGYTLNASDHTIDIKEATKNEASI